MKSIETYSAYTREDFLADDDFIRWSKYPDAANNTSWTEVFETYPSLQQSADAARDIIIAISTQVIRNDNDAKEATWQNIITSSNIKYRSPAILRLYKWRSVAASIIIITAASCLAYYAYLHSSKTVQTDFAATQNIVLPDESEITLNRNSSITYARVWTASRAREVSLTGEAFFRVKHVAVAGEPARADSFRVVVNNIRATVLGTEFNIHSRRGSTTIALQKGKLRIDFLDETKPPVFLLPGQEFTTGSLRQTSLHQVADTTAAAAWTKQSLVLEGTTVADIVNLLQDEYGYTVEVKDKAILQRKLRGSVPMTDINNLFFVLSNILDVNIQQDGKTLIISDN